MISCGIMVLEINRVYSSTNRYLVEEYKKMDKSEIIKKVAPCSLMCHTCSAYNDGIICASAKTLLKYLEGIKEFYEVHMPDAVESYNNFEGVLSIYAGASCSGCRSTEHNGCSIEGCFLLECTKNHGVDFCGECNEFPCKKTQGIFEEIVYRQWLEGNQQIREYGIEAFWKIIPKIRIIDHIKNDLNSNLSSRSLIAALLFEFFRKEKLLCKNGS